MPQIDSNTGPHPLLLAAIFFVGMSIFLAAGKNHIHSVFLSVGNALMFGSIGWQLARWWYLTR